MSMKSLSFWFNNRIEEAKFLELLIGLQSQGGVDIVPRLRETEEFEEDNGIVRFKFCRVPVIWNRKTGNVMVVPANREAWVYCRAIVAKKSVKSKCGWVDDAFSEKFHVAWSDSFLFAVLKSIESVSELFRRWLYVKDDSRTKRLSRILIEYAKSEPLAYVWRRFHDRIDYKIEGPHGIFGIHQTVEMWLELSYERQCPTQMCTRTAAQSIIIAESERKS